MFINEVSRAIFNRRMALVIIIMLVLQYLSSYSNILSSYYFINREADDLNPEGLKKILEIGGNVYHIWLYSFTYTEVIFVLAAIYPYTASYVYEKKLKFHYFSIIRSGHTRYLLSKMIANALAGGIALAVPTALYFIGLSFFFERKILHPFEFHPLGLMSQVFPDAPWLYVIFVILIHFILGFSIAVFSMGITSFFPKVAYVYAVTYGLYLFYDVFISNIPSLKKFALTQIYYIKSNVALTWPDVFLLHGALILIGFLTFYINGKVEFKYGK